MTDHTRDPRGRPDRRLILRAAGAAGLAGSVAAACSSSGGGGPLPTGSPTSGPPATSPSPAPTPAHSPTAADWDALSRAVGGRLVRPGQAAYPSALQLFDPRFDTLRPAGIAYCSSPAEVAAGLKFARETGVGVTARAGGHSYAGYSSGSGLVLDVTRMAGVTTGPGTATVGAGARLVDVYGKLAAAKASIPAGSCPTVGVAGLALGGGIGVVGRRYGLTCDRMTGADVVLASGEVVRADARHHTDLFWALRGGGGGNFGVVTSFTFETHPTSTLALFTYRWDWSVAGDVLTAWQNWAPSAPDPLWSNCQLSAAGGGPAPRVVVNGVYVGPSSALKPLLDGLVSAVGRAPVATFTDDRDYLASMLLEAGCSGKTVDACHLPSQNPAGTLSRVAQLAASDFFTAKLPAAGVNTVITSIEKRRAMTGVGGGAVLFDSSGGAINRVPPGETAFVHRSSWASAQYIAGYTVGAPDATQRANAGWLADFHDAMRPYASGFAYQNYIDPHLADWRRAYYGDNYARLVRVKRAYDPDGLFHFPQAVPTR